MHKTKRLILAVAALALASTPAAAQSIGVNFVGRDSDQTTLRASDYAGIVPQGNWNNIVGEPFSGGPTAMNDDQGQVTTVTLTWAANDSWRHDGALPDVPATDEILLKGIHKANPDPDTDTGPSSRMVFTFANLEAANTYDVIAYVAHNGAGAQADMTIDSATYYVECQSPATLPFVRSTSTTSGNYPLANYVRWDGVSPDASGTIVLTAQKNVVDPQVTDGIGVSAIQVVRSGYVPPASSPPVITGQPADVLAVEGATVTFTVTADAQWDVQWQKDGVDISGATSSVYSFTAAAADDGATYVAVVSNTAGSVTSRAALLEVDAAVAPVLTQGVVPMKEYTGLTADPGVNPQTPYGDLYPDANFPDNPARTLYNLGLDVPQTSPDLNNFGRLLEFVVKFPQAGDVRFFTRSDDGSELHVGTSSAIPDVDWVNDIPHIAEAGCCDPFFEPTDANAQNATTDPAKLAYSLTAKTTQNADLLTVTAGQELGMVYTYVDGTGGDYGQLAMRYEGDTTAAASLTPISPEYVWGLASPAGHRAEITSQPQPTTGQEGRKAEFSVAAAVRPSTDPLAIQWFKDGVLIPGATGTSYKTPVLTLADSGAQYFAKFYSLAGTLESDTVELTVVPDTFAPVPSAGALVNRDGTTIDVGVGFDEVVTDATASVEANYTLNNGTLSSFTYYPESQSVLMKVTGLNPGDTGTVTVRNVSDGPGNAIPAEGVEATFTVSENLTWDIAGDPTTELSDWGPFPVEGNFVVPVADDGFDIFSNGRTAWNNYDETVFIYEEITGDFDKNLRVEYQDNSSQWARAGLVMRERTNFGDDVDAQRGSADWNNNANADPDGIASRYQKVHVNPVGPTLTGPGTDGNGSWEGNRRLNEGGESSSAGGGGLPLYPDAWCRLQRVGDAFTIYRSDDGQNWIQLGSTTFDPPMPETVFVGPDYTPEIGNITLPEDRGTFLAKIRDYGDTFGTEPNPPALSVVVEATGDLTITFEGTLESSTAADGTYGAVPGATSPYTVTPSDSMMFFRAVR
jgi:hypothetical protein